MHESGHPQQVLSALLKFRSRHLIRLALCNSVQKLQEMSYVQVHDYRPRTTVASHVASM